MLNYQLHCFNRKVITTKIPKDLDLHIPSKPKWCNLSQPEICNCTETGCLHRRKLNMQNVQNQPLSNDIRSTRFICHVAEWCWNHSMRRLALLGCADIILSNNSCCWVVMTSFYLTICIKIHFDVLCDSRQHNAPYYSNVPSISTHMLTVQCIAVNKVIGTVHYTSNLNKLSEPKGSD